MSAQEIEPVFDRYTLQAEASREVDNDLMLAVLRVQDEDADSAALSDRINHTMLWALLQLESYPNISSATRNYRTTPVYGDSGDGRVTGWRSSQDLALEGVNFEEMRTVIGELQEQLQLVSMSFEPQKTTRQQVEDALIADALSAFRERASLISQSMQAGSYRVLRVNVMTQGSAAPYPVARMAMADTALREKSPVAVSAGTATVSVTVSGEIVLNPPVKPPSQDAQISN
ncbi:SIMPL domain-containing protein [Granulosicoccaceae sp. 1_MG-2023]|nr:SIMPL domain-containing protein [Granulosicoccaceae sp. 1_MG-2023]